MTLQRDNMRPLDVAIVIVNWNTSEMLRRCLASIRKNVGGIKYEVIVVDNASADGSPHMVREEFPEFVLLESGANLGFAKGNNCAVEYLNSKYVLYLNPDTVVKPGAVEKLRTFLEEDPCVAAVGSRMTDEDGTTQPLGLQWYPTPFSELFSMLFVTKQTVDRLSWLIPTHDCSKSGYVKKLYGGCLMVRKSVLEQVGYFDERFFMYGEDVDLCQRITEAGWRLYYLYDSEIVHLCGAASKKASQRFSILMRCESIGKLMKKKYGWPGETLYRIAMLLGANVRLALIGLGVIPRMACGRSRELGNSAGKYLAIIRWSLYLEKPRIAR